MTEIDFASYDLTQPKHRYRILSKIPPDRAAVRMLHTELRDLFRREMKYRKSGSPALPNDEYDYADMSYWCGLLLYLIGDPADTPLMWEAKNIDFDLGCAFDIQFMVGAGVDQTIRYLESHGTNDAVEYLESCRRARDFEDLRGWERFRIHYFYPNITSPEDA
ncbi:MAG TPA: hypothetical protein VLL05_12485 [Terriglobales bacterium]|nr:hypothetical protein [Terriglobales bacterium]